MPKILKHIFVVICLLPLLFFNINNTHDWGDDFAQYLTEAKNILEHRSLDKTNFIQNPEYILGPNCYPPGFPLIIAATSSITHFQINRLNVLISFFLLLIGYFSFLLLHRYFSYFTSLLLALIICYNPLCLLLKNQVLSDIPFTASLLLFFVLYLKENKNIWMYVLTGIVMTLAIQIKYVGWILLFAYLAEVIFSSAHHYFKNKKLEKNNFIHHAYIISGFLVSMLLFYAFFPQKIIYYDNVNALPLVDRMLLNLDYNYAVLLYFFSCFKKGFLNDWISYGFIFSALAGMIWFIFKSYNNKPLIILFFTLGYCASILIHQYSNTGVRLLLPIITFILLFTTFFFSNVFAKLHNKNAIGALMCLLVLWCYKDETVTILSLKNEIPGPYSQDATVAFDFIKKNTAENANILFCKPRALTYFTNRKTFINTEWAGTKKIEQDLAKYNPDYVLTCNYETDDSTKIYFSKPMENWKEIYAEGDFRLLKRQ